MDRENAESRVREMEDHLAELQDEMRKDNGNKTVAEMHGHINTPTESSEFFLEDTCYLQVLNSKRVLKSKFCIS